MNKRRPLCLLFLNQPHELIHRPTVNYVKMPKIRLINQPTNHSIHLFCLAHLFSPYRLGSYIRARAPSLVFSVYLFLYRRREIIFCQQIYQHH